MKDTMMQIDTVILLTAFTVSFFYVAFALLVTGVIHYFDSQYDMSGIPPLCYSPFDDDQIYMTDVMNGVYGVNGVHVIGNYIHNGDDGTATTVCDDDDDDDDGWYYINGDNNDDDNISEISMESVVTKMNNTAIHRDRVWFRTVAY